MNQVALLQQVPFVDLRTQYSAMAPEIDEAIAEVLHQADFVLGHDVTLFEAEFAAYCGASYAIGVDSGTSALELTLRALGVGAGDEVVTVANTFIATALAITYTGATPVLVDADPQTYTIDVSKIEKAITRHTRAIIPVHLYGQPADMDPILQVAERHGLAVLEDACQAHGAEYKGRRAGSLGTAAAFSFYPSKNLGAYGDGGMVVTSDPALAAEVRSLRNYGQKDKYHYSQLGFNRRLDTLQAAVLRVKLKRLDRWNALRRQHASSYDRLFAGSGLVTPHVADYATHVYHLYVLQVPDRRDELRTYVQRYNISTGIHYPIAVHLQESYRSLGLDKGSFAVSEHLAEHILSLPMFPELLPEQLESVSERILAFFGTPGSW